MENKKSADAKLPLVESYFNVNFSNDKKPKKVNKKPKVNQIEKATDNLIGSSTHLKPPDSGNEKYDLIRNDLSDQLEAQGKFGKHYESILDHLVYFFKLKDELQYDIETNGIRIEISTGNGHPKIVDNPSIKNLNSVSSRIMTIIKDPNLEDEEPRMVLHLMNLPKIVIEYIEFVGNNPDAISNDIKKLIENVVIPTFNDENTYFDEETFNRCISFCERWFYPLFPFRSLGMQWHLYIEKIIQI
ncbi:hypothetical protein MGH68_07215 [Erysipelothrix sp. D19-032]